jgi:hypothetical protein
VPIIIPYNPRGSSYSHSAPIAPEAITRGGRVLLVAMLLTSLMRYAIRRRIAKEHRDKLVAERERRLDELAHRVHLAGAKGVRVPFAMAFGSLHVPREGVEVVFEGGGRATLDPAGFITGFGGVPLARGTGDVDIELVAGTDFWILAEPVEETATGGDPFRASGAVPTLRAVDDRYRLATSRDDLLDPIPDATQTYLGWIFPLVVWGSFELLALGGPSETCSALVIAIGFFAFFFEMFAFLASFGAPSKPPSK